MKSSAVILLTAFALGAVQVPAAGREVVLGLGETFRESDLTVRCAESAEPQLTVLTDCQFWDNFDQVCLHERQTFHYARLQCVAECQHWDSFDSTCHYASSCELLPAQRAFLRTSCDFFDNAGNVCRRSRQDLLR